LRVQPADAREGDRAHRAGSGHGRLGGQEGLRRRRSRVPQAPDGLEDPGGSHRRPPLRLRCVRCLWRLSRVEVAPGGIRPPRSPRLGLLGGDLGADLPAHPARDPSAPARGRGRLSGRLPRALPRAAPLSTRPHAGGSVGARGAAARDQYRRLRRPAPPTPAPAPEGSLTNSRPSPQNSRPFAIPSHGSPVAQSVERRTVNPLVVGSSPTRGANKSSTYSIPAQVLSFRLGPRRSTVAVAFGLCR